MVTVCAVDANGVQPTYGERGANLLVCAPSSNDENDANSMIESYITTTALENKYRSDFTGTSASTPMVSGVVALMLAANPELTWRDVRIILASTARQNDFPAREAPAPDPEWTTQFGLHFSHKYGFGVANAEAAVQAARSWKTVGGSSSLLKCGPYAETVSAAVPDPAGAGVTPVPVTSPINVPACAIGKIEFVEVRFTGSHALTGEWQIRLRSPHGLVSELADARPCTQASRTVSCGTYSDYPFGSVRHMDEPVNSAGASNWTLEVADTVPGTVGTFGSWSITFFGRAS
jgi:subtilisin-like proprotein convertase family protein